MPTNFKFYLIRLFKILISPTIAYIFRTNVHIVTYLIPVFSLSVLNISLPSDPKSITKAELQELPDGFDKKSYETKAVGRKQYREDNGSSKINANLDENNNLNYCFSTYTSEANANGGHP